MKLVLREKGGAEVLEMGDVYLPLESYGVTTGQTIHCVDLSPSPWMEVLAAENREEKALELGLELAEARGWLTRKSDCTGKDPAKQ
jgi:hypothetical protein